MFSSSFPFAAYYRGAMGILLVYDVTDESSFNSKFSLSTHNIFGLTFLVCSVPIFLILLQTLETGFVISNSTLQIMSTKSWQGTKLTWTRARGYYTSYFIYTDITGLPDSRLMKLTVFLVLDTFFRLCQNQRVKHLLTNMESSSLKQ